jgi:hypothetical protein
MLLRRFTQHVREQSWFAVCLDLLVVVLGIFMGLQVSDWKSAQDDRGMERQYLERLLADMEFSILEQREQAGYDLIGLNNLDVLAQSLFNNELTQDVVDKAVNGLDWMGWVYPPVTNLITVRELQSTGNISLIQSIEIREAIGQLELSFANAKYSADQTSAILTFAQAETMNWAFMAPAPERDWGYAIQPNLEIINSVAGAGNIVSWFSSWSKYHSTWLKAHHEDTLALRDLIKKHLEADEG